MSPSFPPRALQFGIIPTCQVLFFSTFHSSIQGVERLSQETRVPPCRIRGKCAAFRAATVEILSIPKRRIEEVLQMLADSDTLIVTELSRLGRSTAEVIALVNELVAHNIRVIILKQNLDDC
jgi:Resolvase, N terminal domain